MPFLQLPSHRLHYRIDGSEGAPWLTFSNSLGTDLNMWGLQVQALSSRFRILRYDVRGHGRSGAPAGPYRIEQLGGDVLALWDALGVQRSHVCGLSIGGLTGQWLALEASARVERLALCATAAKIGTAESWEARIAQVRETGLAALTDGTRLRWFTPAFQQAHAATVEAVLAVFLATDPQGYASCCHAVGAADFRDRLGAIANPVLALAGDDDPVCPPADLQALADGVGGGRYAQVGGRHICNIESPGEFNRILLDFLAGS
ncbi:3-oxoadipate enol-lactonase [Stenotrophomonas sp. MMGLT7]|uniref:3-oxoadipate enol-lactonase n=1 Tax=Stenotrophomonas sp. MMGLT7 TaxID=2901227 RepID=UPI001E582A26|nr:3-oxoadipate enol-lactonase [Stenotrophomonas sp. MMGLT7]